MSSQGYDAQTLSSEGNRFIALSSTTNIEHEIIFIGTNFIFYRQLRSSKIKSNSFSPSPIPIPFASSSLLFLRD